jgi:hypothetical protein
VSTDIHGKAGIAKPQMITESGAQMLKRQCHDHKTKTSDNWKRIMWLDDSTFTPGQVYVRKIPKEACNSECLVPAVKRLGEYVFFGQQHRGILLVPLLPCMAELLQGSTWTGLGNRPHPMIQTQFPNSDSVLHDDRTAGTVQS